MPMPMPIPIRGAQVLVKEMKRVATIVTMKDNAEILTKSVTQNSTYRVVKYSKPIHRDITITEHTSKMMMTLLRRREATNKWETLDE